MVQNGAMDQAAVVQHILETLPDVETSENYGYTFFFYRDDHMMPFATLASSDNEHDQVSKLYRPGVYRLNLGVGKQTFQALFGEQPIATEDYDFSELDRIMPHPEYARQYFVCVLSPGEETFATVRAMLEEAHGTAKARYERKAAR